MRSALSRNSRNLLLAFVFGIAVGLFGKPLWQHTLVSIAQERFSTLTYKCDDAMRSHLLTKQKLSQDPNEVTVQELQSSEIALLDCQDYDLMRKRLIRWGLSDNDLSEMALAAIEERGETLQQVINIHEIRY